MAASTSIPPFTYPVFSQKKEGYLYLSCPSLNIIVTVEIPPPTSLNGFTQDFALALLKSIGRMEGKINQKINDYIMAGKKPPKIKKVKDYLDPLYKEEKLTVPKVAKLLGVSVNTVRRMADQGRLKCAVSPGGTRYFTRKEILNFTETLSLTN